LASDFVAVTRWLVDGMNLIGSRPDGWWADRAGAMRQLVSELARYVADSGDEVTVVFDGSPSEERPGPVGAAAGRLWVAFAPGGRDAADDVIAERVARVGDPAAIRVVTSDKSLSDRVREHGIEVIPVGRFRRMLDGDA
jgi:predicted RNA-binding protein with PIN domain